MKSRRLLIAILGMWLVVPAQAGQTTTVDTRSVVNDCSDVTFEFEGERAVTGEDRLELGRRDLALRLGDSRGIPLKVVGFDRSGYEVLLCKGTADAGALHEIRLVERGGAVSVIGPEDSDRWAGYLLVRAPRDAELDIETRNGPAKVSEIAGRLRARVNNGPLALTNVRGEIDVEAKNGPVSFSGGSGNARISSQNGPLKITLEGSSWAGGELHASSENGPLTLTIPPGYGSGVVVERGEWTPFRCPAELCGHRATDDRIRERRFELGSGAPRVYLSSENGPISIRETN
ncbi:MAG: hypothetical protein KY432_04990 [Acidobacteria bacterium]|nr:hypothetical protein [Acidobacteriota bacterium]